MTYQSANSLAQYAQELKIRCWNVTDIQCSVNGKGFSQKNHRLQWIPGLLGLRRHKLVRKRTRYCKCKSSNNISSFFIGLYNNIYNPILCTIHCTVSTDICLLGKNFLNLPDQCPIEHLFDGTLIEILAA